MRIGKVAGSILAIACTAVTHAAIAQMAILKRVPVPASAAQCVAVNPVLNRIYLSGGASANQQVAEMSGATYAIAILGPGSGASVDLATNRVWAAGVYDGSALVYDGVSRQLIQTLPRPAPSARDMTRNTGAHGWAHSAAPATIPPLR